MVNNRRNRRVRARRAPANGQPRRIRRLITRASHGFEIVPPRDPPAYVPAPWWPITVVLLTAQDVDCTAQNIYVSVLKQLGWDTYLDTKKTLPIEMRLTSLRIWGQGRLPVQLAVYDHLGGKHRIAEISDYGSPIHFSSVGWKFGNIATFDALEPGDTDVLFEVSGASESNKIMVYVQLLIRTKNALKPTLAWDALKSDDAMVII